MQLLWRYKDEGHSQCQYSAAVYRIVHQPVEPLSIHTNLVENLFKFVEICLFLTCPNGNKSARRSGNNILALQIENRAIAQPSSGYLAGLDQPN